MICNHNGKINLDGVGDFLIHYMGDGRTTAA